LLGRRLAGIYQLDQVLSRGASSIVYKSTDLSRRQVVAIKVLAPYLAADDSLMAAFQQEIHAQRQLRHVNIAATHEFIAEDGLRAIVMEYIEGVGLDQLLYDARGPMPLAHIARIVLPVCSGLAHGHDRGFAHRDLKPSNIAVTYVDGTEQPKIMDFGMAGLLAGGGSRTAPGVVPATLLYTAPEQCKAQTDVDHRADIYSLGVIVYQMLTGVVPFRAESAFEIMLAHVQEPPPPPRLVNPDLSLGLDSVVLRALAKLPTERFQDVHKFADQLKAYLLPETLQAPRSISDGRRPISTDVVIAKSTAPLPHAREVKIEPPRRKRRRSVISDIGAPADTDETPELSQNASTEDPSLAQRERRATASTWANRLRVEVDGPAGWAEIYDPSVSGGGLFCPTDDPPRIGGRVYAEVAFLSGPRFFVRGIVTWRRAKVGPRTADRRARAGIGLQIHPRDRNKVAYVNSWVRGSIGERRGVRRLPVRLRVTYSARSGRRINFTRDINESSVFLRSHELLELGTTIRLLIMPPDESQLFFDLKGEVRRLVEDEEQRGMGVFLAFPHAEAHEAFGEFVRGLERAFLAGMLPDDVIS
jgi:serine/threonine protein kinase